MDQFRDCTNRLPFVACQDRYSGWKSWNVLLVDRTNSCNACEYNTVIWIWSAAMATSQFSKSFPPFRHQRGSPFSELWAHRFPTVSHGFPTVSIFGLLRLNLITASVQLWPRQLKGALPWLSLFSSWINSYSSKSQWSKDLKTKAGHGLPISSHKCQRRDTYEVNPWEAHSYFPQNHIIFHLIDF